MPDAMVAPSGAPATTAGPPKAVAPPTNSYSPNPTMPQYQGTPKPAAAPAAASSPASPAPVTVDPRDATYYDQLARLQYAYNTSLSGYNAGLADATAGYNSTTGALNQQIPLTLANERAKANSQGLLESGILGQRAGLDEANYAGKMGSALSKENAANATAADRWAAAQNSYNVGNSTALAAAIARAQKNDLATQPVTAPVTAPAVLAARAAKLVARGLTSALANGSLRKTAANKAAKKNAGK
jgi:hypothetical protein